VKATRRRSPTPPWPTTGRAAGRDRFMALRTSDRMRLLAFLGAL
jgi:hypothetical protein